MKRRVASAALILSFSFLALVAITSTAQGAGGTYNQHWRNAANENDTEQLTFRCDGPGAFKVYINGFIQD